MSNVRFRRIRAFIPTKISNNTVLKFFEILRKIQHLFLKDYSEQAEKNEKLFQDMGQDINRCGYIENQFSLEKMRYGKSTIGYSGCEIIAVYNAIRGICGREIMSFPQMINCFERDGMVLSGKFGTSPKAINDFLIRNGFSTKFSSKEEEFDSIGQQSDGLILTIYNDGKDIGKMVHSISISRENGKYSAHNVYCNGKTLPAANSVRELIKSINGGRAKAICLIGINEHKA